MILDKQQHLVEKATKLFAEGGYNAVGIDKIIAEAGIAKMTMYRYFPSKNDLILAVLKERDVAFRSSLMEYVEQYDKLTDQMMAVFTWHHNWFNRDDFNGCMFINASAEFHDRKNDAHKISAQHKQLITRYLETLLCGTYSATVANKLAVQIALVLDGAIVAAHVTGNLNAAMDAWEVVQQLLACAARVGNK